MEELEGVVVDDVGRRRRQAQRDGLEIVEDFAIGVVYGAVALIDDDEVEEVRRQVLRFVPDDVEHRGIGRDVDATILGDELFADIRPARLVGHVFLEGVEGLLAQRDPVDEEQHLFGMSRPHQGIDQGDAGAGLARACAITSRKSRFFCSMPSSTERMARIW